MESKEQWKICVALCITVKLNKNDGDEKKKTGKHGICFSIYPPSQFIFSVAFYLPVMSASGYTLFQLQQPIRMNGKSWEVNFTLQRGVWKDLVLLSSR